MYNFTELSQTKQKPVRKKPHIIIYGMNGSGKSTICAPSKFGKGAKNPVYMNLNNGVAHLAVAGKDWLIENYQQASAFFKNLMSQPHSFEELIIDCIDDLERLVFQKALEEINASSRKTYEHISDVPFSRGYDLALEYWQKLLRTLDLLRDKRNIQIIMLAQCDVKKVNDPAGEAYDTYTLRLHGKTLRGETTLEYTKGWADDVYFLKREANLRKDETVFEIKNSEKPIKKKAYGETNLYLYTMEQGGLFAKNRHTMPAKIEANHNAWEKICALHEKFWEGQDYEWYNPNSNKKENDEKLEIIENNYSQESEVAVNN